MFRIEKTRGRRNESFINAGDADMCRERLDLRSCLDGKVWDCSIEFGRTGTQSFLGANQTIQASHAPGSAVHPQYASRSANPHALALCVSDPSQRHRKSDKKDWSAIPQIR
jgi:hypothetical protein